MRKFKEAMKIYATRDEFLELKAQTLRFIKKLFKDYRRPYVAFSGGKDSTVLLHLTLLIEKDVDVVHTDWGPAFVPRNIKDRILRNAMKIGAKKENLKVLKVKEGWRLSQREIPGIPPSFWVELKSLIDANGFDLVLLGFRADESRKRWKRTRRILDTRRDPHEAYPLRDWSFEDVYAYIYSEGLPLLRHYDDYSELLGYDRTRWVTYFDSEFDHLGASYVDGVLRPEYRHPDIEE